ncbi:uncharacterized protein LOC117578130 [Drosophila albomicans]|uniref:Uncharacterized protein LOC117578130 n=1 Tax=Drosophila albomicans TaxID=7291 RepID=A0A6P8ZG38_DROAB|nr:uncharacterized protein LOC117578130 [Drosophila albomicans]XP_051864052.1 uncharacterized protein LOC117578130 [Drosophila albomicans]
MLETKSIAALASNNIETPRKRKRETTGNKTVALPPLKVQDAAAPVPVTASCFTNAAFSSTPKTLVVGRRRLPKDSENINPFVGHPGLEFKSISELAKQPEPSLSNNPFEVLRQPSKKKKRDAVCFENPALNLELPERQFNPYEVVRCVATPPSKCFINQALNLRGSDAPASLNPFEIHRRSEISAAASNPAGVENPALSEEPLPTSLKIGLPFAPSMGYRIDFNGLELAHLTPSKLFAEKLVFSPVQPLAKSEPKRSLGAISEEESTMDIGKELDRYQLELENSINEAKLRKNGVLEEPKISEVEQPEHLSVLTEIKELEPSPAEQQLPPRRSLRCRRIQTLTEIRETIEERIEVEQAVVVEEQPQPQLDVAVVTEDVAYASESEPDEDEDELDFKAPARFVRAYRPAATTNVNVGSKESLQSIASSKSAKSAESHGGHGVRNIIRKSIRKLMHPMQHQHAEEAQPAAQQQQQHHGSNIISSIRHSLRRRPQKQTQPQPLVEEESQRPADISIVDSSERTMKLRSNVPQTEYMRIEQLTNEKKHTLRNSLRRSTRDVLRHVFHKSQQDAYATAK